MEIHTEVDPGHPCYNDQNPEHWTSTTDEDEE